jgi:glycosyltransferase involved in cell wall biosynthesis
MPEHTINRFGTIYPFVEDAAGRRAIGRRVANYEFFNALLRFGTWEHYDIFCFNPRHREATRAEIDSWCLTDFRRSQIRLLLFDDLTACLRDHEYRSFHSGDWGYLFTGLLHLRRRQARRPFPVTAGIHSLHPRDARAWALDLLSAPSAACDAVLCSSDSGRRVMEHLFNEIQREHASDDRELAFRGRMPVPPLGVSDSLVPCFDKPSCRRRFRIPADATVILHLGRFCPVTKMDIRPLLLVFRHLAQASHNPLLHLVLAGATGMEGCGWVEHEVLECGISEQVTVVSDFTPDDKRVIYGAADVFVSLSDNLQETFGLTVLEAAGMGLPVVVSDWNGYRELVRDGVDGFLIPTVGAVEPPCAELAGIQDSATRLLASAQSTAVDIVVLLDRLSRLIRNPGLRAAMGGQARRRVDEHYYWSRLIPRYEALWLELGRTASDHSGPAPDRRPAGRRVFRALSQPASAAEGQGSSRCARLGRRRRWLATALLRDQSPASCRPHRHAARRCRQEHSYCPGNRRGGVPAAPAPGNPLPDPLAGQVRSGPDRTAASSALLGVCSLFARRTRFLHPTRRIPLKSMCTFPYDHPWFKNTTFGAFRRSCRPHT